jgi:hypothetical protein
VPHWKASSIFYGSLLFSYGIEVLIADQDFRSDLTEQVSIHETASADAGVFEFLKFFVPSASVWDVRLLASR